MGIRKIKDNLLHINNLRKAVGYAAFLSATRSEAKHEILETLSRGNVLVIAPHPDDDVFGCGGTIAMHAKQKDGIKIVYFSASNNRKKETEEAARKLGVKEDNLVFLNQKEGHISANSKAIKSLANIVAEFKPKTIYAPSFLDPNRDHFEVAKILTHVFKKVPFSGTVFLYEVWSPIYANRLVVIDKFFRAKVEAMSEHKSQLKDRDYLGAMTGLARYRAGMFNAGQYAEAFFSCNKGLYLKLFDLISLK